MAALTQAARVRVRAPLPGEGAAVASLWRELWDAHEQWGGYPGSRDPRVYAQLAARLDDDARVRSGHPILGHHVHLVADLRGVPCGQVEGWFEHRGLPGLNAPTCEVRSLIVTARARRLGAGRALLEAIAGAAREMARGAPTVLAAEVLDPNPARAFYARLGYSPVAWSARIAAEHNVPRESTPFAARLAVSQDALALARLEATLAARRRAAGDLRFDRPHAIDATAVAAIAAHLAATAGATDPVTLVAADAAGVPRGAATFNVQSLEPPFLPVRRALLGRFALDPAFAAAPLVAPMVALARRLASARGASHVEMTDLSAPGTDLYAAAIAAGAAPWSRVVIRG
ncbi:MAG TPA: GNAT family N-acetyltransferase [Polyangiaceae bacterium]|nr:GNAT family N-acetyltransferase [Polyangiaceae bacterium]